MGLEIQTCGAKTETRSFSRILSRATKMAARLALLRHGRQAMSLNAR
jgi:hypothetical protein